MTTQVTGPAQINPFDLTLDSSTQEMAFGTRVETPDGRAFRYVEAGGTALVVGKLQQAPVEDTAHQNLTITAASAVGDTTVNFTLGGSAVTLNEYSGGYLMVTSTPGQGYQYLIASHPAADSSAALVVTLSDPIRVALTTSSVIDLVLSPWRVLVVNPASATSAPAGVAVTAISANQFGWIQVGGVACILSDGGSTVGTNVSASNGTDGAVEAQVTVQASVGVALTGVATTEYGAFLLNIE